MNVGEFIGGSMVIARALYVFYLTIKFLFSEELDDYID